MAFVALALAFGLAFSFALASFVSFAGFLLEVWAVQLAVLPLATEGAVLGNG